MTRFLILAAGALVVAACSDGREQPPAPVVYQGSQPDSRATSRPAPSGAPAQAPAPVSSTSEASAPTNAPQPAAAAAAPGVTDTRGVTFYDGYQTITAQQGDTVDSMARRVGIDGAELAAYNGLSTLYSPLPGDELVLPARPDGYRGAARVAAAPSGPTTQAAPAPQAAPSSGSGWSPALVTAAIESGNRTEAPTGPETGQTAPENQSDQSAALDAAAASDPQPEPTLAPTVAAPAPEPAPQPEPVLTTQAPQPTPAPATAPEASPAPQPTQQVALAPAVETPAVQPGKFMRPVNAPILRPFSKRAGPDRNDGVDFDSPAGTPVVAADSGVVVLVSRSLGGLGTILLIRHENEFLTVYGRISDVVVAKGDRVQRGQVIAKVADLKPPRSSALHFEIRRGPESVDPEQFI